jgi:hypothetical protein
MGNTPDKRNKGITEAAGAVKQAAEKGQDAAGRAVDKGKAAAGRGAGTGQEATD